jgi:general secretion pathway protein N
MTPFRAIYSATLVTLVGLSSGIALDRPRSQELTMRNELMTESNSRQAGQAEPIGTAVQTSALPVTTKSPGGNVWPAETMGRPNPLWAIPIATLTATRERPIFSPSRRPPPPAPGPLAQQPTRANERDRPLLALVGTVAGAADGIAIFQDETSKKIVRLRTGESHSGWTLTEVKPREVNLLHNSETATFAILSPPAK